MSSQIRKKMHPQMWYNENENHQRHWEEFRERKNRRQMTLKGVASLQLTSLQQQRKPEGSAMISSFC